ncbi:MAG: PAS domain-containing hybrid sensor histidine kinase/response regulator, partial [Pseudomonadota bacterium]
ANETILATFGNDLGGGQWIVMTTLSFCAILLLPRQFHVAVTENNSETELRRAAWLFPLYLVVINIFVLPIAAAGLVFLGPNVNADTFVLTLPLAFEAPSIALLAFIGGLSAATAMVIVASVALAIMISNDLIVPLLLRRSAMESRTVGDMGPLLLTIRRSAIFATMLLAYAYYSLAGGTAALASIGLLAFAAIAQFAPALFGGLFWRRATARGAIAGMLAGFAVWAYALLLPTFVEAGLIGRTILDDGPFGIWLLKPQALFTISFDPLIHGVFWSLTVNIACYISFSLTRAPEPLERLQANIFVPYEFSPSPQLRFSRPAIKVAALQETISGYLGKERTARSYDRYAVESGTELVPDAIADPQLLRFSEHMLASAVGAASSRLILSLLGERSDPKARKAHKLLDDATAALQYNRDLLQTALDQVGQGISVFDKDLRLICWNRQFRDLLELPAEFGHVGTPLTKILRRNAEHGVFQGRSVAAIIDDRIERLVVRQETFQETIATTGRVLEVRTNPMPGGGIVTTYSDITERVAAAERLEEVNESLERRVRERTEELTWLNGELIEAKATADDANLGKTRFLAAAGHDILQPLNAARLYVTSLVDKLAASENAETARNIEASLESVEDIIGAVLDISRLDTGAMKPEIGPFPVADLLENVRVEFGPVAANRGLDLRIVGCSATIRTDKRLLRRLLQNLVSNGIKYTKTGRILVGCRRRGKDLRIDVIDTGIGIDEAEKSDVFKEFRRLDPGIEAARGLGLGLSIVDRIARVLKHDLTMESKLGKGSRFSITVPTTLDLPRTATQAAQPQSPHHRLRGLRIMCIDNEPSILDGMRVLLEGWECTVLTAADPAEAERVILEYGETPHALLVDYHLDDANGIDTIRKLRWKFGAELPAALITADRSKAVRDKASQGSIAILRKPVKPASLRALLSQTRNPAQAAE